MLHLNLQSMMTLRGVENPVAFLVRHQFDYQTARRLMSNPNYRLTFAQMEQLCLVLQCTPNDLIKFTPNENTPPNHALRALVHEEIDVLQKLRNMSIEELAAFNKLLQEKPYSK